MMNQQQCPLTDSRTKTDGKQKAIQAEKSSHIVQLSAGSLQRLAFFWSSLIGMVKQLQLQMRTSWLFTISFRVEGKFELTASVRS